MPLPIKFNSAVSNKLGIDETKQQKLIATYQAKKEESDKYIKEHSEDIKKKQEEIKINLENKPKQSNTTSEKKVIKSNSSKTVKSKKTTVKSIEKTIVKEIIPFITKNDYIYDYIGDLLIDKTTGKNIIFATDSYEHNPTEELTSDLIKDLIASKKLLPRVYKSIEAQKERTKKKAEVFTPSWVCQQMIEMCEPPKDWQELIKSTWLEITCGEAPFIVMLYDSTTGEKIPIEKRSGVLDRKLQAINKNIIQDNYDSEKSYKQAWIKNVITAYQTTYGYEWQGDNLFIARCNLIQTFFDYFYDKWGYDVKNSKTIEKIIEIIQWNFWQMDGLKDTVPFTDTYAKIKDWSKNEIIDFKECKNY